MPQLKYLVFGYLVAGLLSVGVTIGMIWLVCIMIKAVFGL